MDSGVLASSHACSVTTGGNLCLTRHSTKNLYYANSSAIKGLHLKGKSQIEHNALRFKHCKFIEEGSTHQECNRKNVAKAVPEPSFESEPRAFHSKTIFNSTKNLLVALYKLSLPYSMIGMVISITSSSFLAVDKLSDISPLFFIGLLQAVVPHMFIIMYVNGVNQMFDFEIDKINKPYLPLTSGQLSFKAIVIISATFLILSIWLSWIIGSWPLIWRLISIFLLWTAYSINVPLLRWKRNPWLTTMIMVVSSALILPISSFLHMQTFVLKRPTVFPRSLIFVIVFMSFYSAGVTLAKDMPDVEGDKAHGIDTFSISMGQKRVFWICVFLFETAFGVAIVAGATSPYLWSQFVTVVGHVVLASVLYYKANYVDFQSKSSIASFYRLIWKVILFKTTLTIYAVQY
ncbi:hypothetical protein Fmac_022900 [Flemingia macrophylla]|uniref:Uncharacterized protein n=1 Tax=Flemingia macrophylla TaxID=520843 RepID=A0ABD1LJZ8_9FABA